MPSAQIPEIFRQVARFHAQPLEKKLEIKLDKHNVGYLPMKGDTLRTSVVATVTKPNLNEALFVARDLAARPSRRVADRRFRSANRWPSGLPGFREVVVAYCDTMERLAQKLVRLYARALGLPAEYFDPLQRAAIQTAHDALSAPGRPARRRVRDCPAHRYQFPHAARPQRGAGSVDPHAKRQMDRRAGHSRRLCRQRRPAAAALDQRCFLATPHRAVNRSGGERYALAFFCDSNIDWPVAAVPTCVGPDKPPKYPTTYYTDYMIRYQKRTYNVFGTENKDAAE